MPYTKQYYILTQDPLFRRVLIWVLESDIPHELHINRLRFRPHSDTVLLEFYLQYRDVCEAVESPYPTVF